MSRHSHLPPYVDEAIRTFIRRHKRALRWGLLTAFVLVVALILAAAWGLLYSAGRLKSWIAGETPFVRLPLEWEKPLGDAALTQLRGQFQFITNRMVLTPLDSLASPLFNGLTNTADRFTLLVSESKDVNAIALPGGCIVFHRGLLERAKTAEEVQGVLAHEMAHVQKRHGVLQLAQNIGLNMAVQQLMGGENRLLDSMVRDSGQLLSLKFSRDHERAADDLGWEILVKSHINPQGMESFFAGLNAAMDNNSAPAIPLLSTHPAPQERLERLRQKSAALGARKFRSFSEEFNALRDGLGLTPGKP